METLELGPTPCNELCAQVGSETYYERAKLECKAYMRQLLRMYKDAHGGVDLPADCYLKVTSHSHDFGTYHEVGVRFDEKNESSIDAAYWLEGNLPAEWDDIAKIELELQK